MTRSSVRLSEDQEVNAYSKWQGAFWRLISLVDLGVEEGHSGADSSRSVSETARGASREVVEASD